MLIQVLYQLSSTITFFFGISLIIIIIYYNMQNNCIYYTKLAYVDHFMSAAKGVDAEDKVMELLNDIEN